MSEFWHKMSCCVVAKPPPKKKRRKIDRTMIGEPMNFVHLTHIGSGEMAEGLSPSGPIQEQMSCQGEIKDQPGSSDSSSTLLPNQPSWGGTRHPTCST
ncbi:hypothetical protein COCON_G00006450 [Conger conger]|uniref:CRIB domain-containing protein n=1 Tax=Conger conger TaxID=82655 RepID=A0A9Q1I8M6_CONCO|nr:hypothetical protein COCON_G00006450 [Conger conger]